MRDKIIVSLIFLLVVGVPIFGFLSLEAWRCGKHGAMADKKAEYVYFSGCYIEVNGRMVPLKNWRGEYERD